MNSHTETRNDAPSVEDKKIHSEQPLETLVPNCYILTGEKVGDLMLAQDQVGRKEKTCFDNDFGWLFSEKSDAEKIAEKYSRSNAQIKISPIFSKRAKRKWYGTELEIKSVGLETRYLISKKTLDHREITILALCEKGNFHHSFLSDNFPPDDFNEKQKEAFNHIKPSFDDWKKDQVLCEEMKKQWLDCEDKINQAASTKSTTQGSYKLNFISAHALIQQPPSINWIIKPYLDAGSLSVLFGEPGCMKSFLAIDMGLCIASNRDWHDLPTRKSGPVFYIAGEGVAGIPRRLRAWTIANKIDSKDIPFFASNRPIQLLDKQSALEVVAAFDELKTTCGTPVLVIIDTLNRNFGPGDENKTEDMTAFISSVDIHIRLRYGCAVLIVHHSPLNDPGRARGASALRASLDWEYKLNKQSGDARLFSVTKVKDHEQPPDICFQPVPIALDGWIDPDDGQVMTSCVLKKRNSNDPKHNKTTELTTPQKIALDCLIKLNQDQDSGNGVHIDSWRDSAYKAGISKSSNSESRKKAFQRARDDLEHKCLIETHNEYYWLYGTRDKDGTFKGHVPAN